jgi:AGZA family xanthine/uracil permease-like MFS transporter
MIIDAIPRSLKFSIAAGIGVFIAFIGLHNAGIIVANPATLVKLGNLHAPSTLVAVVGTGIIAALMAARVRGAILIGIVVTGVIAVVAGVVETPTGISGVVGLPVIEKPAFFRLDIISVFKQIYIYLAPIMILLFFDMFDTIGTLIGVGEQAGFLDKNGRLPRAGRALLSDSIGTMIGAVSGTSTVTSYIESAAGVAEGGRTGFANMVTAALLLVPIFFFPLVKLFGDYEPVTAPALLMIGVLMMRNIASVRWDDITDAIPAFLTVIMMPLTFSIANGLAIGFISYPVVKALSGRAKEVHWLVYVLGAFFTARYIFLPA